MTAARSTAPTATPLRLMLVDEDPVFRLGLRIWLEQTAGHRVVAEAAEAAEALTHLARLAGSATSGSRPDSEAAWSPEAAPAWADAWADALGPPQPALDLVILDVGLGVGQPEQIPGLGLCVEIKSRYPDLPVLVLSAQAEPVLVAAARRMGADGVGARAMAVADLDRLIRRLARSQPPGPSPETRVAGASDGLTSPRPPRPPRVLDRGTPATPRGLTGLRYRLRQSSVRQIEAVMAQIEAEQRRGRGSLLSEAVLAGRYRELRAARWLMNRLLATPAIAGVSSGGMPSSRGSAGREAPLRPAPDYGLDTQNRLPRQGQGSAGDGLAVAPSAGLVLEPTDLANQVFEGLFSKLQGPLDNTSGVPLETDILRDDKKRELFYLTLRKFEDALGHLRQAQVPPGQLAEKSPLVLHDVWEAVILDFFGRYYTLQLDNLEQPVVPTLLTEAAVVQAAILDRIPLVPMLLGHLLYNEPMIVDGGIYEATTSAALGRSQALLEHALIQLANGAVQPLLNNFADVELLKKTLYQRRMITSRDIERFRNDLSWRYRWDGLIDEPRAIFESQHRLFSFTERGIQTQFIYSPRREELDRLSGLQRAVTLVVEARDAVAPRFRSAVALVGSGIVYVLTDVIGRGIGLIGRGILRGVGGGWRDPRYRRSDQDDDLGD